MTNVGSAVLCLFQFVDDSCFQVEKYDRNARTFGVLAYIPRFSLHTYSTLPPSIFSVISFYLKYIIFSCSNIVFCLVVAI